MQDDLLLYYERELTYLRRMGAEFAARYPKVASRLQLEAGKCDDPHVERLLQGFAFLSARVHRRIDDDLPEVSEALLDVMHPQLVRPIPSCSIVTLELDPELGKLPGGVRVARGSEMRSRPVQGMPCRFRTVYDTTLWPLTVGAAEWAGPDRVGGVRLGETVGVVRVELQAFPGTRLGALAVAPASEAVLAGRPVPPAADGEGARGLDALRFHLAGETSVTDTLYELLLNSCGGVVVRDPDQPSRAPVVLPPHAVRPVGFEPDESLLPYPRRLFGGYALLQEVFVLPQKFLFVEVAGLAAALRALDAGPRAELCFAVAPFERPERRQFLELGVSARTLRLGCTPVVNLFEHGADPILLTERQAEYPVVPDVRRRLEIEAWAVERAAGVARGRGEPTPLAPLYDFRHGRGSADGVFWHAVRRPSAWRTDRGTELAVSFADLSGRVRAPEAEVVSLTLTCYNGDLPSRLPFGVDERGDFELAQAAPLRRIVALLKPTAVVQPALGSALVWRLISTLSLNHLSLVDDGVEALRELLRLHNAGGSTAGDRQIQGVVGVRSAPAFARVVGDHGIAFARGRRVELELDEEQFPGGGLFLFASVLERFLGLYATMNSFTQLAARSRQRRRVVREWAPRAGCRTLV